MECCWRKGVFQYPPICQNNNLVLPDYRSIFLILQRRNPHKEKNVIKAAMHRCSCIIDVTQKFLEDKEASPGVFTEDEDYILLNQLVEVEVFDFTKL